MQGCTITSPKAESNIFRQTILCFGYIDYILGLVFEANIEASLKVEPFSNRVPIVIDLVLPILPTSCLTGYIVLASFISFKSAKKTPSNYLRFLLCCTFSFELRQKCGFYMSKTCLLFLNIGVRTSLRGDILHTFLLFFLQPFETR